MHSAYNINEPSTPTVYTVEFAVPVDKRATVMWKARQALIDTFLVNTRDGG